MFTPTLTGLGERSHSGTPSTGLYTHIADITETLTYEDLRDVTLVGHSYGGMVITGVSNEMRDRIQRLIYLDAFVPEDEQSLADLLGPQVMAVVREHLTGQAEWRIPPMMTAAFGLTPEDAKWVGARLVGHPLQSWVERLSPAQCPPPPAAFIFCNNPPLGLLRRSFRRAKTKGWTCRELDSGHDAMISAPAAVSELLIELSEV